MQALKNVIKRTPLYEIIKFWRARKFHRQWTPQDQSMLEFYSQFLSPGDLCFDVGANIGNRVKIFLKLQARVVAIEPQDDCVKILQKIYGHNPQLSVIQKVLGESAGQAELMICEANTISSLSPEWIEAVRQSGRFSSYTWEEKQVVSMTTLDQLINQYGVPAFIKIDVEGFEYQVIKGLTQSVKTLSLEYTPEFLEPTFQCIEYLQHLGDIRLNYSFGETMQLVSSHWVNSKEMVEILSGLRGGSQIFGDLYIQF